MNDITFYLTEQDLRGFCRICRSGRIPRRRSGNICMMYGPLRIMRGWISL